MSALERAKFLFDLNGYYIIRGALSQSEIKAANQGIDAHEFHERKGALRTAADDTAFTGDQTTGRFDMAGMLGWEEPHRNIFRNILNHPSLVPYLHLLVGKGYRLDHSPLVIAQERGSVGFSLHGGPLTSSGKMNPLLQYQCHTGEIYNTLLAVSVQLTDHNEGDGGYCVVPGSHKINFPAPPELMRGDDAEFLRDTIVQPVTQAGDIVLFSEATIHGCLPWKADRQRRIALYRFSPAHVAFARGYSYPSWPASFLEGMTEAQRAVMEPPYHPMYDRPRLDDQGESDTPISRSKVKTDFDHEVFGERYY